MDQRRPPLMKHFVVVGQIKTKHFVEEKKFAAFFVLTDFGSFLECICQKKLNMEVCMII